MREAEPGVTNRLDPGRFQVSTKAERGGRGTMPLMIPIRLVAMRNRTVSPELVLGVADSSSKSSDKMDSHREVNHVNPGSHDVE